jgi:(p)ppGpp synthase/HD superfamily hydrolase
LDLKIEVKTLEHLDYIIGRVRRVKDVIDVKRILTKSKKY